MRDMIKLLNLFLILPKNSTVIIQSFFRIVQMVVKKSSKKSSKKMTNDVKLFMVSVVTCQLIKVVSCVQKVLAKSNTLQPRFYGFLFGYQCGRGLQKIHQKTNKIIKRAKMTTKSCKLVLLILNLVLNDAMQLPSLLAVQIILCSINSFVSNGSWNN